jgi:hypothetical protein
VKIPLSRIAALILTCGSLLGSANPAKSDTASIEKKLAHIEANGKLAHPDQAPTVLTEEEVNAYLASGAVSMPAGVESVRLQGQPGVINGAARVDFDKVREGVHSSNPLLSLFSGVHNVEVATHAYAAGGQGYVHVDSVSLDGVEVPRFVLQMFVEKYLQPRYPDIGLDSKFKLADRIDTATVGNHTLTVVQK